MSTLPKPMTAEGALRLFFDHTGAQLAQDGLGRVAREQWRRDMAWTLTVLRGLKRGDCWCEMAIGNPMVNHHSSACEAISKIEAALREEAT